MLLLINNANITRATVHMLRAHSNPRLGEENKSDKSNNRLSPTKRRKRNTRSRSHARKKRNATDNIINKYIHNYPVISNYSTPELGILANAAKKAN
jgi:hypothetical protein